jgi:hemerythrin
MAFLLWTPALSVGVRQFDEQHRSLVGMLNDLHTAMLQGRGKEALGAILDRLVAYAATHFTDEEQLLQRHAYPDLAAHREEHRKLVEQVLVLQEQYRTGRAGLTVAVMVFLKDWLVQHIQVSDRKYGVFFRALGVG